MIDEMAANLTATMKCFAKASTMGQVHDLPGLTLVDAGSDNAIFNSALLTSRVDSELDLDERIRTAVQYFIGRRSGWSFWVCEGLLANPIRRRLERIFSRHGLALTSTTPGLAAEALKAAVRPLPQLEVRMVSDQASRKSFCHIMSMSFSGPSEQLTRVYGSAEIWKTDLHGFLGSVDGTDLTAGATVVSNGVIGIYAVGTLPAFTRQGYAEALMRHAIDETFHAAGHLPLVLQSTSIALRLYRRMGFRSITGFSLYSAP